jgi:DNA polymerase
MPIAAVLPGRRTLRTLETAARGCRACLWRRATQTVFGEGAPAAEVMLVGEQPGKPKAAEIRVCRPWLDA